jgi:GNAT superfamily N-acetyltransferase
LSNLVDIHHVTDVFVDGFARLQRVLGDVQRDAYEGVPFLYFAEGRRQTRFAYEFFPVATAPERAVQAAIAIAGISPHLISAIDSPGPDDRSAYAALGYDYWGEERLMTRPLAAADSVPDDGDVQRIEDLALAARVVDAQERAGLRPHPITADHLDDPTIVQRAILVEDAPVAFGRVVTIGTDAYVSDIVTLPAFRGRGLATRLVRRLLSDAAAMGCVQAVLTSSMMAQGVYARLGFVDVARLSGFETPKPAP